ncbi:MAG: family 43 glycosylhydrolase [Prevotellaceae bacterium]|jgi:hypothetical protein|nr:family 43 glycosylhydrolase [Prevotellaceae bacterium]
MKKIIVANILALFAIIAGSGCGGGGRDECRAVRTACNPIDLSYRFRLEAPSRREAADPSIVRFGDDYYLFVSKSGGYFRSSDLVEWELIVPESEFPLENYAPTAEVIGDAVYFITSGYDKVLKSTDPKSGKWEVARENLDLAKSDADPALFLDDDGRLYFYGGCSNLDPIRGMELDPETFGIIGSPLPMLNSIREKYGWEVQGDYNTLPERRPWIEGAWLNKHNGRYYLQYAGPGTEFKSYNDGVYVADSPLGPFTLAAHNPFAYKPEGFAPGAGHGSTFKDKYGNCWHAGTVNISMRHSFERRLSLFPVFFDEDGEMYAHTGFGDYPYIVPDRKINSPEELFPEWMLLSYNKKVIVSSTLERDEAIDEDMNRWWIKAEDFSGKNAVDEEIRTWWSAKTGKAGEWFAVDLERECEVYALQINFADQNADLYGRSRGIRYLYTVESSDDGKTWKTLFDRLHDTLRDNLRDAPHEYIQLKTPAKTRYLRINNIAVPSGRFSLHDFRVFGKSGIDAPPAVEGFAAERGSDRRTVHLSWNEAQGASGYNIRFGTKEGKLYQNYMVYSKTELSVNVLNVDQPYFFSIDSFNEGGISKGSAVIKTL